MSLCLRGKRYFYTLAFKKLYVFFIRTFMVFAMNLGSGTIIHAGPNRYLIGYGKRTWENTPQSKEIPHFFFPDFFLESANPWFRHEKWQYLSSNEVKELFKSKEPAAIPIKWQSPYKELFYNEFAQLQKLFIDGKLLKAVPFVFEQSSEKMTEERLIHSLNAALEYCRTSTAYLYGFWEENQGILGATPEVLFRLKNGNELQTMALAGTYRISQGGNPDSLLKDHKEMHEHHLVIQGILESLKALEAELVLEETRVLHLPHIAHLVTPIQGKIRKGSFYELVQALHPTPALGAFPKKEGLLWLRQYQEKIKRRRFGAPVGFVHGDTSACLVAIRNVQWTDNGICIGAGCGVVPASQVDREWQEIQSKLTATKMLLGFA